MYCDKCGADNSDTASFCRKCGAAFAEVETRVGARPIVVEPLKTPRVIDTPVYVPPATPTTAAAEGHEAEIFRIRPTLKFIKAGYIAAAVGGVLLVALSSAYFSFVPIWLSVVFGLLLLLIPAFYHMRQMMVRYTLTDSKLEIDEGFIARRTRSVPIRRIQDVTVSAGITQRMLGFGNLVIDNASEEGGNLVLKNIDAPKHHADLLLKQMRQIER